MYELVPHPFADKFRVLDSTQSCHLAHRLSFTWLQVNGNLCVLLKDRLCYLLEFILEVGKIVNLRKLGHFLDQWVRGSRSLFIRSSIGGIAAFPCLSLAERSDRISLSVRGKADYDAEQQATHRVLSKDIVNQI